MNVEDLYRMAEEKLTVRPTPDAVKAEVRTSLVNEIVSKQNRIAELEQEASVARESLRNSEEMVSALDAPSSTETPQG